MSNQCQGCQKGWGFTKHSLNFVDGTVGLHIVEGGYKGEVLMCTKDKYEEINPRDKRK